MHIYAKRIFTLLFIASLNVAILAGCTDNYDASKEESSKEESSQEEAANAEEGADEGEIGDVSDKDLIEESAIEESTINASSEPVVEEAPTPTPEKKEELKMDAELAGADAKVFKDSLNTPYISIYLALENTGNVPFSLKKMYMDFEDNNGRLLGTDKYLVTIPEVILPGQVGYVYSYYYNLTGVDVSNGFKPMPQGEPIPVSNVYVIEISDISVKNDWSNWITVTARGTNNSGRDISFATPGAIFFDKNDKVVGFCYGVESFASGETKSFEISGDLMSSDIKPSDVDHVQVWCVGSY